MCAFCGVEPSIYQSGTSYHEGKMVKHGSLLIIKTKIILMAKLKKLNLM
ncbi:MAG: hypothetical protein ACLRMQ_01055 [Clostridium perfringens]